MAEPSLSILIPTLTTRKVMFDELVVELFRQRDLCGYEVEIISKEDAGELTCGAKRNRLLKAARGKYCVFIDDDDAISPDYLSAYAPMIEYGTYTHASLVGMYYENGVPRKPFVHSTFYKEWSETPEQYNRMPNHLNVVLTEIARKVGFPEVNYGEDYSYSKWLWAGGLLRSEFSAGRAPLYHYLDGMKENRLEFKHKWDGKNLVLERR